MVIGSEKGYVYPYDIMTDPKKKKVNYSLYYICSKHLILKMKVER